MTNIKECFLLTTLFIVSFSCKTENKSKLDSIALEPKKSTSIAFNKSDFETMDISNFQSNYLLIGEQKAFSKNRVSALTIVGHESYELNNQGLITKTVNISNNHREFVYNKNGQLLKVLHKQHHPELTYFERLYKYSNQGDLIEIIETHFNENFEMDKRKIITIPEELAKIKAPFKRALEFEPYKIDYHKRLILTYRADLIFCCGEKMDGKNRLRYYYGLNGLIDSLIIEKTDLSKTMKFSYKYTYK